MKLFALLFAGVVALACGGENPTITEREDARVAVVDTGPSDTCDGLAESEGRCVGMGSEVCIRSRLVQRNCREGFVCVEENNQALCECGNVVDDDCPRGCADDPDCANCTPVCDGRACGDNGCGGVCGSCETGEVCSEDGMCNEFTGLCTDDCQYADDGECDDGGPGSVYDECELGTDCIDCGVRDEEEQTVNCVVGYNEDCPDTQRCECNETSGACVCMPGTRGDGGLGDSCAAQNDCASALCVSDRCSRVCDNSTPCEAPLGECQSILGFCVEGSCEANCGGRECGADGCGGTCGSCDGGNVCVSGNCETQAGDTLSCPGSAGQCERGESCCITSPDGSRSRCLEHATDRDRLCRMSAEDDETYGYLGCNGDEDCGGSQVCCGGRNTTYCAESCDDGGPVCDTGAPACSGDLRCCPLNTPPWFSGDYGVGRCLPSSCP